MAGTSKWGSLVADADTPPIWAERVVIGRDQLVLTAQAWRTNRLDIKLIGVDPETWVAGREIMGELITAIADGLDWTKGAQIETRGGDPAEFTHHVIVRVDSGHMLEPAINLIARFKTRWDG